jgi:hypothetical protein
MNILELGKNASNVTNLPVSLAEPEQAVEKVPEYVILRSPANGGTTKNLFIFAGGGKPLPYGLRYSCM